MCVCLVYWRTQVHRVDTTLFTLIVQFTDQYLTLSTILPGTESLYGLGEHKVALQLKRLVQCVRVWVWVYYWTISLPSVTTMITKACYYYSHFGFFVEVVRLISKYFKFYHLTKHKHSQLSIVVTIKLMKYHNCLTSWPQKLI